MKSREIETGESRDDQRFSCLPYRNSSILIASQLLQISAFSLAYAFMGVFFIGFVPMIMQQFLWCCRQRKSELLISSVLSVLAACVTFTSGIYVLMNWSDPDWCDPIFFFLFWKPGEMQCGGRDSAVLAFVGAALWLASAALSTIYITRESNKRATIGISDHFDCEAGPSDYQKKREESRKHESSISKSEQFAPPRNAREHSERTTSRKSTIDITKSEQFAPPEGVYDHSTRTTSRKSTIDITKSEQFAPPEGVFDHSERTTSQKNTIDVTKSEQFAPPEGVYEYTQRTESRRCLMDVTESEEFASSNGVYDMRPL